MTATISKINGRLRYIYENEGMSYGPDVTDPDELKKREVEAMKITRENIRQVMARVKNAKTVDFCFVLDATGSMRRHIEGVKDSIKKIFKTLMLSRDNPGGIEKLRIAIVIYRDFCDEEQVKIYAFTDDENQCIINLKDIVTSGGGDGAEDVFGGLEAAIKLPWSAEAGTRIVFHICDAPCHGKQYHGKQVSDDYPDGDPDGRSADNLLGKLKSKNILYHFGKINNSTDQMIDEFSIAYREFISIFDVQDVVNIAGSVITSISTSVTNNLSMVTTFQASQRTHGPTLQLDTTEPKWDSLEYEEFDCIVYALPNSVNDILDDKELKTHSYSSKIKMPNSFFASGSERAVRKALLKGPAQIMLGANSEMWYLPERIGRSLQVVLKEYKNSHTAPVELTKCLISAEILSAASFLALEFNKAVGDDRLKFLPCAVIKHKSDSSIVFTCEPMLDRNKKFFKFTNNLDFSMQQQAYSDVSSELIDLLTAFSHWTWCETDRQLLVADLQGCVEKSENTADKVILTDPAIHYVQGDRFGSTNLGRDGIIGFFKSHSCNAVCKRLGLDKQRPKTM